MRHIYVHVPFCARRCVYCDFAIAVRRDVPSGSFVDDITAELDMRRSTAAWDDAPIETIYFGGGTPSRIAGDALTALIERLSAVGGSAVASYAEITLEANPEDVSQKAAETWVRAGVNRISLGAQSFQPNVLEWMHRMHTADQTIEARQTLREAGINNLSLDLIFGLPPELQHDFTRDLNTALELEPDHVSVYGLTVEAHTPLSHRSARGQTVAAPDSGYEADFLLADRILTGDGFEHYEVSNYARSGKRAVHNGSYWGGRPYAGLGPSAHSFIGSERRWNEREWAEYHAVVAQGRDPIAGSETLTPEQLVLESTMLGLRTKEGIERRRLAGVAAVEDLVDQGWMTLASGRARLTPEGWLRMEALLTRLTT